MVIPSDPIPGTEMPFVSTPLLPADTVLLKDIDVKKPEPDDLRLWSITTIIGALDKPALVYWAANETAKAAVRSVKSVAALVEEGNALQAIDMLKKARFSPPPGERTAAKLGTAVHEKLEEYALTGIMPEADAEITPFLVSFDRWCQKWQPEYIAAEMPVYSPTYGYAGTSDGIMKIGGMTVLFDYKTSKKSWDDKGKPTTPYPEVGLQIAAARYAEFAAQWRPRRLEEFRRRYYLLGPAEQASMTAVPEVDGGVAIHLTPEHCDAYPVRCDRDVHTAFLYVLEAARFQFEMSKTIIGAPLVHPSEV